MISEAAISDKSFIRVSAPHLINLKQAAKICNMQLQTCTIFVYTNRPKSAGFHLPSRNIHGYINGSGDFPEEYVNLISYDMI
jgi:hypothetical protein